jgi:hypothetical protein
VAKKNIGISRKSDGAIIKAPKDLVDNHLAQNEGFAYASKSQLRRQKKYLAKYEKQFDRILHQKKIKNEYYMSDALQGKIRELQSKIIELDAENQTIKKELNDFQIVLLARIEEIEKTPKFWRFLHYGKLVLDLFDTVRQMVQKQRTRVKI